MRTLSLVGLALAAATVTAPSAGAQRHSRRASRAHSAPPGASARAVTAARSECSTDCDDYSLSVVSAVLPSEAAGTEAESITLVIENRGRSASPASVVLVAPKNHLSLVRQSGIRSLAPGERATVELPVEFGPDGTPCVSITIRSAPVAPAPNPRFLAAGAPSPPVPSPERVLPGERMWAGAEQWGFVSPFNTVITEFAASTLAVG